MSFKDFSAGDVFTAADADTLMRQGTMVFASTSARDTALSGNLAEGMRAFTTDTDTFYYYDGSGWQVESSPWVSYTPSWNNFTVGNATVTARRRWEQGSLHLRGVVTLGSTSSISGTLQQVIPDSLTTDAAGASGNATLNDQGTQVYSGSVNVPPSLTYFTFYSPTGLVNASTPFTWTTSDVFTWDVVITAS